MPELVDTLSIVCSNEDS